MELKTKYEIGHHVWVVDECRKEVCVYDDYIAWIMYDEDGLNYGLKESCNSMEEEDIILFGEEEALVNRIKKVMKEIRENEKGVK